MSKWTGVNPMPDAAEILLDRPHRIAVRAAGFTDLEKAARMCFSDDALESIQGVVDNPNAELFDAYVHQVRYEYHADDCLCRGVEYTPLYAPEDVPSTADDGGAE